jgi:hypothetical protein
MSQTRIQCEDHKGTKRDLALAIAKGMGWKFHTDGWLTITDPKGFPVWPEDIESEIFSPVGRELMEKYSLKIFVPCSFKSSTTNIRLPEGEIDCECDIVGMIKGILYRGEGSHQDMNIACALAFHELVTGEKFVLIDGGEVTEVER